MTPLNDVEVWQRGPLPGVAPLLMPAAHALVQAREDVTRAASDVSVDKLWRKTGQAAPAGFHVRHLGGALDRLLTYARGEMLTDTQKRAAGAEGTPGADGATLVAEAQAAIDRALDQIRATDPATLLDAREVGRARLPTTVLGLIFHAAEHSTRHAGQLITTLKMIE